MASPSSGRDGSKKNKSAAIVSAKSAAAPTKNTAKREVVVDVSLPGKNKQTKRPVKAATKKTEKLSTKSAKKTLSEKATAAKGSSKNSEKRSSLSLESPEEPAINPFGTPPPEALRAFRKARAERVMLLRKVRKESASARAQFLAKGFKAGKKYSFDLRIHSPGTEGYFSTGGVEAASALVRLAKAKGLDLIAVTDFYSTEYIDAVRESAAKAKIIVIPGFDICCQIGECREVFFTVLFPQDTPVTVLNETLRALDVPEGAEGSRALVLEDSIAQVVEIIESRGGMLIPSRIDKNPYRQLAIRELVEIHGFRTFDLVHPDNTDFFRERWPSGGFLFFSFSNANALAQVGSRIVRMRLPTASFEAIKEVAQRQPIRD